MIVSVMYDFTYMLQKPKLVICLVIEVHMIDFAQDSLISGYERGYFTEIPRRISFNLWRRRFQRSIHF